VLYRHNEYDGSPDNDIYLIKFFYLFVVKILNKITDQGLKFTKLRKQQKTVPQVMNLLSMELKVSPIVRGAYML
jgi:hypothetical protein